MSTIWAHASLAFTRISYYLYAYQFGAALALTLLIVLVVLATILVRKALKSKGSQLQPAPIESTAIGSASSREFQHQAADVQVQTPQQNTPTVTGQYSTREVNREEIKARVEAAKKEVYRARKLAKAEERKLKLEKQLQLAEDAQVATEEAARIEREKRAATTKQIEAETGKTLAAGLAKTRQTGFMARVHQLVSQPANENTLAQLEEVLFTADIGVKTAARLVAFARSTAAGKELKEVIRSEVEQIVNLPASHALAGSASPHVIMVVGVNGAGKTTTIGKLAARATSAGKKVLLAAGDTFRAAASNQLNIWAKRSGADILVSEGNKDAASVVFDAVKQATADGYDLLLADTAGRLHTKKNLMEELKKVRRVMDKALRGAPHELLLVLDATNGQNAIIQAEQFQEAVGVTAIALTKLDGTAKGGVIISICDALKIPVAWVGVGEQPADLRPFVGKEFVQALFD